MANTLLETDLTNKYCRSGKCQRSPENRIVLPGGAPIPRDLPGKLIKDWIDKWHRRNLSSIKLTPMTMTMLHTIATEPITIPTIPSYHLSTTDRIATLEAELFNLRAQDLNTTSQIKTRVTN